jgi:ankyrin repeat protein
LLIAEGADVPPKDYVDKANNNGVTPLMAAARDGFTSIVLKLLAAGADFAQVDEFGRTADSVADEKGFPETCAAVKAWAEAHPK